MTLSRKPPRHLKAAGRKLWSDIAAEYGVDDAAGLHLLTTACEALDLLRAAQCAIRKHGETVLDRYGCVKINPACGLVKEFSRRDAAGLEANEFGYRTFAGSRRQTGTCHHVDAPEFDQCQLSGQGFSAISGLRVSDAAAIAYSKGLYAETMHATNGRPWLCSPLDCDQGDPPELAKPRPQLESWKQAQELQRALEAACKRLGLPLPPPAFESADDDDATDDETTGSAHGPS